MWSAVIDKTNVPALLPRKKVEAERVIALRRANLCRTSMSIAEEVGISRERVRQILSKANQPTTYYGYGKGQTCPICGGHKGYKTKICVHCSSMGTVQVSCSTCNKLFDNLFTC
jgi:hypothetical protein